MAVSRSAYYFCSAELGLDTQSLLIPAANLLVDKSFFPFLDVFTFPLLMFPNTLRAGRDSMPVEGFDQFPRPRL